MHPGKTVPPGWNGPGSHLATGASRGGEGRGAISCREAFPGIAAGLANCLAPARLCPPRRCHLAERHPGAPEGLQPRRSRSSGPSLFPGVPRGAGNTELTEQSSCKGWAYVRAKARPKADRIKAFPEVSGAAISRESFSPPPPVFQPSGREEACWKGKWISRLGKHGTGIWLA